MLDRFKVAEADRGYVRQEQMQPRWEIFNITKAPSSLDGQEARRAFFEERDPEFTGRGK